jgi:polyisoprenoid-binding protein YceI
MRVFLPIILVLIVVGGIFYFKTSGDKMTENTESSSPEIMGEEVSSEVSGNYTVDTNESNAKWTGSKKIVKDYYDNGTISIKSGNVMIEEGNISGGEIVFDMKSITTLSTGKGDGQDNLTKHLKSEDFFEVETYGESTYKVTSSEKTADGYLLKGELTIKNKTNALDVPVKLVQQGENIAMSGKVEVNRADFDVKFGSESFFDDLGDNVINDIFTLEFMVVAKK